MERETYYSSGKYLGEGERKSRTTIVPRKQLDLKVWKSSKSFVIEIMQYLNLDRTIG